MWDKSGEDYFIQAVKNNDKSKLIDLMENTWDEINQPIYFGMTLLYYAVLFDNLNMSMFLLEKGASITIKNEDRLTGDHEIEKVYYYTGNGILNIATESEERVLKEYQRFTYNHGGNTPLDLAIGNDNRDILKLFIKNNPKNKELQKQFLQSNAGDLDILKLLMEYNPNIDTLFELSISEEKSEIVELLIKKGANFNFIKNEYGDKFVALKSACIMQNLKIVKILIENGADVNIAGYEGRTALFDAIEATRANKEIISYLIQNGADIHKEDDKGITPLSFAQTNKKSLVKVLTEQEKVMLSENQDSDTMANYQTLSNKILGQNKVINKLKDEVKTIKSNDEDNKIEELKLQIDIFKESILSQSNEIKELQNKLISKEENTKNIIDGFTREVNKLEKKLNKRKVVKTKIPINIPVENHSIKKDDGVIVKRESFDDF